MLLPVLLPDYGWRRFPSALNTVFTVYLQYCLFQLLESEKVFFLVKLLGGFPETGAEKIPADSHTSSIIMTLPKAPSLLK